jgi:hypothetical protein
VADPGATPEHDPPALDAVERRFWGGIWAAADPKAVAAHGIAIERFGPVQATAIEDLPRARMLNLVLGAGEAGAVEDGHLAAAVEWADARGADYYVPVTPGAPGADRATRWLDGNGFECGYGWMKFVRNASEPNLPEPEGVEIRELAEGEGEPFGAIAAAGFGLPAWAGALFTDLPGRPGWRCYVATVDGAEAACAAMLVDRDIAELGIAATLESARGRGCQLALLARRILDAGAAGCETLFVETGEQVADRPSGSYRNILRAGFREAYARPNWQRPA